MFLSLLDKFEKENGKSATAGVAAHDARFEFALWLERNAAQPAAVCNVCGSEIISHQIGQRAVCSNRDCSTRR